MKSIPAKNILYAAGKRLGSTRTLFSATNAGEQAQMEQQSAIQLEQQRRAMEMFSIMLGGVRR